MLCEITQQLVAPGTLDAVYKYISLISPMATLNLDICQTNLNACHVNCPSLRGGLVLPVYIFDLHRSRLFKDSHGSFCVGTGHEPFQLAVCDGV